MAKLFAALEGIGDGLEKVASGLGDGIQKVADKTESLTTRINRHVNPLSSHYGEHRQQRVGAVHGQHEAQPGGGNSGGYPSRRLHHPTHSAGERTVDIPLDATDISSRDAPSPQVRRTWDRQLTTERKDWHVQSSTDTSKGFTRAACQVTQKALDAVEKEIQDLQREKEDYTRTLNELKRLEAEQEAEYAKAEQELKGKEERLRGELLGAGGAGGGAGQAVNGRGDELVL